MLGSLLLGLLFLHNVSLCPSSAVNSEYSYIPRELFSSFVRDFGQPTSRIGAGVVENFVKSKISSSFSEYNTELQYYSHVEAMIAWNISINANTESLDKNEKFRIEKNIWNNHWCGELLKLHDSMEFGHFPYLWDEQHLRQLYLICRGPRFTSYQLSHVLRVLSNLQEIYNKEVCIPSLGKCMRMEPDLNRFMENCREESKLREVWTTWHDEIGKEVKPLYASLVQMLNQGAKQAGHKDMGQCWREETEIGDLREFVLKLYSDIKYLYQLLHSFVRHKLEKYYSVQFPKGLIPAHLLGNMWAQKWDSLINIAWSNDDELVSKNSSTSSSSSDSLVNKILPANATVKDMVKAAENFFLSMGLPRLPESFWENSYFEEEEGDKPPGIQGHRKANSRNCHGSAANMFGSIWKNGKYTGDYRMMMCAKVNDEDLITIHHEVGHIMYFMAYSHLPTIFQEGANSAFHESVGDAITYDLVKGYKQEPRMKSLLKTGLAKLPQIGFGLIMDMWRWEVFENPENLSTWNSLWWEMHENFLGIARPTPSHPLNEGLDAAGKFHIIDNIPYVRYFLASFLQLQMYDAMCKETSGWNGDLHECTIQGSHKAGTALWRMMAKGSSRKWTDILKEMTGSGEIESTSLLQYFEPLKLWLEEQVRHNKISVGW